MRKGNRLSIGIGPRRFPGYCGVGNPENFVTKPFLKPLCAVWNAPGVVGKSDEPAIPVTYALPAASTAIASASSSVPPEARPVLPLRKLEETRPKPAGLNCVTKAAQSSRKGSWTATRVTRRVVDHRQPTNQ